MEQSTVACVASVSFLARPKPRISFLGLSLLRNSTETLATQAKSTANSNSFKIAQKTAFEAKGRLYTTGKVLQRLFIIDLYT